MYPLRKTLSALFVLATLSAAATDSAFVQIRFIAPLGTSKFAVTLHDGINEHPLPVSGQMNWKGELYSPYGHIQIYYKKTDSAYIPKRIFFRKGNSNIALVADPDPDKYYSVQEKKADNFVMFDALGGAGLQAFIKPAEDSAMMHYHRHKQHFYTDTSLLNRQFALGDSVAARKIDYIRQHPDQYISFWLFLTEIIRTNLLNPKQLQELYNTAVPDAIKNTRSGTYLDNRIKQKIAITYQRAFPDFNVKDLDNNIVSSSALRGNLVLIQFWASWCKPCMEEVPELKKINEKYHGSPFKLISFNVEKDSLACRNAISKHTMNWPQVHGNLELYNAMSYAPIPQLYLVDKTGRTIYNSTIVRDNDLGLLKKILSEQLGK